MGEKPSPPGGGGQRPKKVCFPQLGLRLRALFTFAFSDVGGGGARPGVGRCPKLTQPPPSRGSMLWPVLDRTVWTSVCFQGCRKRCCPLRTRRMRTGRWRRGLWRWLKVCCSSRSPVPGRVGAVLVRRGGKGKDVGTHDWGDRKGNERNRMQVRRGGGGGCEVMRTRAGSVSLCRTRDDPWGRIWCVRTEV